MALIDCPECSKEVSDQAATCPHCGGTIDRTKRFETQEIEKWQISFRNNVHMYCHHLEVAKGAYRFDVPCEDTPAGFIGIWVKRMPNIEDEIRDEMILVLTKFFDGLGRNYEIL